MPPKAEAKTRQTVTQGNELASLERDVVEKELVINTLRQKLDRCDANDIKTSRPLQSSNLKNFMSGSRYAKRDESIRQRLTASIMQDERAGRTPD